MKLTKNFTNNVLQNLSDNEVATYILIKSHYDNIILEREEQVTIQVTLSGLYYELAKTFDVPRKLENNLIEGLEGLTKRNVVSIIDSDSKSGKINKSTNLALDVTNLWIDTDSENFAQVTYNELAKVFNYNTKNKFGLLRFACIVLGTLSNDKRNQGYKCGWYAIRKLQEMSKIGSNNTVLKMLDILEELKVLYIHHSEDVKTDANGQIKNLPSVYSRYSDKDKADKYYLSMAGKQAYDFTKQLSTEERRAITTDYNRFLKGKYAGGLKDLIKKCIAYNEQPYFEENDWVKDMTVFDDELLKEVEAELQEQADSKKEARQEAKEKSKAKKAEQPKVTKVAKVKHEATPEMFAKWGMKGSTLEEVKENMAKQEAEMRKALMLQEEEKQQALEEEMYNNPYSSYNSYNDELFW